MKWKLRKYKGYKIKALIAYCLLVLLFVASIALLVLQIREGVGTSSENQGYVRYLARVTDIRNEKGVVTISNEISDACWNQAEKEAGVKLPRYSETILLENFER